MRKIDPNNRNKRKKLKSIRTIAEYNAYANALKLTAEQRQIMDMVFVKGYPYALIGDKLGYSESTIKHKVGKILKAI